MYNLDKDAVTNFPNFYCEFGIRELYSLEEAKTIAKDFMKERYDFNTKLEEFLKNVDSCKNVLGVQTYLCNSILKGFGFKIKSNLSRLYKNQNR